MPKRAFFKPGDLRLADTNFRSNFHLRPALEKTKLNDAPFPCRQLIQPAFYGDAVEPEVIRAALIADLIHYIDRIAVIMIDRLKQGNRPPLPPPSWES